MCASCRSYCDAAWAGDFARVHEVFAGLAHFSWTIPLARPFDDYTIERRCDLDAWALEQLTEQSPLGPWRVQHDGRPVLYVLGGVLEGPTLVTPDLTARDRRMLRREFRLDGAHLLARQVCLPVSALRDCPVLGFSSHHEVEEPDEDRD